MYERDFNPISKLDAEEACITGICAFKATNQCSGSLPLIRRNLNRL